MQAASAHLSILVQLPALELQERAPPCASWPPVAPPAALEAAIAAAAELGARAALRMKDRTPPRIFLQLSTLMAGAGGVSETCTQAFSQARPKQ